MRPWSKVGSDIFQLGNRHYIVIVDYFSNFTEVFPLLYNNSEEIIQIFEQVFARHGIPDILITDNGLQYKSRLFREFSSSWQFEHETSSPYNSQSNGKAESAVKVMKSLLTKCNESGQNFY